ncbi:hypothetical protein FVE85_4680 [Porphyridium purpureum]|uniref:Uncharacterized protein n=1 Tax=Porphyridium purpureum TaxID=35688 RepID=A0A5J4YRX1_PORPP|nr:hypothetical protein FVE85_4680 [Porphyridium purpureum]|eukprot:POR9813..scf236_6
METVDITAELEDVFADSGSTWTDPDTQGEACKHALSSLQARGFDAADDEFSFLADFDVDDAMISSLSSLPPSIEQVTPHPCKAMTMPMHEAFALEAVTPEMLTPCSSKRSLEAMKAVGEASDSVCNTVDSELGLFYPEISARKHVKTGNKASPGGSSRFMSPLMSQIYGTGDLPGAVDTTDDVAVEPSRFCHICTKSAKVVRQAVCYNVQTGSCRKVICEKCFAENGWDFELATAPDNEWYCCHCMRICPTRAQCNVYKKNTQRTRPSRAHGCKGKKGGAGGGSAAVAGVNAAAGGATTTRPANAAVLPSMMDPAALMSALAAMGPGSQPSQPVFEGLTPLHFSMFLQQMSMLAQQSGMAPSPGRASDSRE